MSRFGSILLTTLVSATLVGASFSTPAFAEEPVPTPTATETPAPAAATTVDLTGQLSRLADEPGVAPSTLFHVLGEGYLPIDASALTLGKQSTGTITLRLAVPAGVGSDFDSLLSHVGDTAEPVTALQIVPNTTNTSARVNQTPSAAATHKIFAVVVTPSNVAGSAVTESQSLANIQADVASANAYWLSQTENRVGFSLAATGDWYKSSYSCDVANPANFTNLYIEAGNYAYDELGWRDAYNNHLVLIFPSGSDCGAAIGLGTVGSSANSGGHLWAIGTESPSERQTLAHELGHNLSLGHANWLDCSSSAPDPGYFANQCPEYEYGDASDIMGYGVDGSAGGSLSSAQAIRAGLWSTSAWVAAPQGTTSYVINALSSNSGRRAVVVEDTVGTNFFVDYRNATGIDAESSGFGCGVGACGNSIPGVRVSRLEVQDIGFDWAYKGFWGDNSQLIGRHVGADDLVTYTLGQSFSLNGVVVTVTALTATTATVSVTRPAVSSANGFVDVFCTLCTDGPDWTVGDTVTAMLDWDWVADSYAFQWYRNGVAIAGATAQSYKLTAADLGRYFTVKATAYTAGSATRTATDPPAGSGLAWGPVEPGLIITGEVSIDATSLPFVATLSAWTEPGLAYSYQWYRNGDSIIGAEGVAYTPVAADANKQLSVSATARKAGYNTVGAFSAPRNYTLTSAGSLVIAGAPVVGQELSVNTLSYSTVDGPASPTFAYQWLRSGVVIAGATGATYPLVAADLGKPISVKVVAHASGYASNTATSAPTAAVIRGDFHGSFAVPTVQLNSATKVLTANLPVGSVLETPTLTYQWYRGAVKIPTGIAQTYTLTAADYGANISVRVIITRLNYNSMFLTSVPVPYYVGIDGPITVTGPARVGVTLEVTSQTYFTADGPVTPTLTYQWLRNGVAIAGAIGATYTTVAIDYGTKISARITGSVTGLLPSIVTTPQTVPLIKGAFSGDMAVPVVTNAVPTLKLTAALPPSSVTDVATKTYQWLRNGAPIYLATATTFQMTAADTGKSISVRVTVTKPNFTTVVLTSLPVNYSIVPNTVPILSGVPYAGATFSYDTRTYTAQNEGTIAPTESFVWLRDGVAIAGATSDEYISTSADLGKSLALRVTATLPGLLTSVSTSVATQKLGQNFFSGYNSVPTVEHTTGSMTLTAVPGVTDVPPTLYAYQWFRSGVAIPLATASTYTLTAADAAKLISVRVSASKATYTPVVATSTPLPYSLVAESGASLTGSQSVNGTLGVETPSYHSPDGPEFPSFSYQWLRNGAVIAGATNDTYTALPIDAGTKLSVRVTASVGGWVSNVLVSNASPAIAKAAFGVEFLSHPVVTIDPVTFKLTASIDPTKVTDTGFTPTYQWFRGDVAIPLATAATYQLTAADYGKQIGVRATLSKTGYTPYVYSVYSRNYSLNASPPFVPLNGQAAVGQTMSIETDATHYTTYDGEVFEPDVVISYVWLRSGVAIAGATASDYTVVEADRGKTIAVRMTAAYPGFMSSVRTSPASQIVGNFINDSRSTWPETQLNTSTMTITQSWPGISTTGVTFARQWYRNGVAIYLATGQSYHLTAADAEKTIFVRVTATRAGYTKVVKDSDAINYSVVPTGAVSVVGTPRVGVNLTVDLPDYENDAGDPLSPTFAYQWYRNGVAIAGATSATRAPVALDLGTKLSVRVIASVSGYLSVARMSPQMVAVVKGVIAGDYALPTVSTSAVPGKFTAVLPLGSIDEVPVVTTYQWYRNGVAISLATGVSYTPTALDYGKEISVRVTVSKAGYSTVVMLSPFIIP